jgi:hypothetical protein
MTNFQMSGLASAMSDFVTQADLMRVAMQYFIDLWAQLVSDVLTAAPEAKGKILLDLINEPDGYGFTW